MSNTIITGGSGFLATEFLKKLKNKKNIYLISRKKLKINKNFNNIICDLRNKSNTIKIFKKKLILAQFIILRGKESQSLIKKIS